jgi:hypothetical protein
LLVTTSIWAQSTTVSLVNGLDARLIEAEAFLAAGDIVNYLATLNALRAAPPKIGTVQPAPMAPLTDPGTATARQAQLFSEKAFWTFGRGQRLFDMRRLERQYAWPDSAVFPTGPHYRGVAYGPAVNLPVPHDEPNTNPFAGSGIGSEAIGGRRPKTEDGSTKTEDRRPRTERGAIAISVFGPRSSVFCSWSTLSKSPRRRMCCRRH